MKNEKIDFSKAYGLMLHRLHPFGKRKRLWTIRLNEIKHVLCCTTSSNPTSFSITAHKIFSQIKEYYRFNMKDYQRIYEFIRVYFRRDFSISRPCVRRLSSQEMLQKDKLSDLNLQSP